MDRVLPAARVVLQDPFLDGVLLHREAGDVAVHELTVDGPLAFGSLEPKRARDLGDRRLVGERIELRDESRIEAGINHAGKNNVEPEEHVALTGPQDGARRASSADLLQAVLQEDRRPHGKLREVDDDVGALGDTETDALDLERPRQEITVV